MKLKIIAGISVFSLFLISCLKTNVVENNNQKHGLLKGAYHLEVSNTKQFQLDSNTSPKVQCSQIYTDSSLRKNYTLLNKINKTIYFFDYDKPGFISKIPINTKEIINAQGYFIKAKDSIYVFDKSAMMLCLMNQKGEVLKKMSLIGDKNLKKDRWYFNFPQYDMQAATSFIETPTELLLIGQYMESLPDSLAGQFKFVAHVNLKTDKINFTHLYPKALYGGNANWDGQLYTQVYADVNPNTNKLFISFPVSHEVFVEKKQGSYEAVYAGSNFAETISSLPIAPGKTNNIDLRSHFVKNDVYAALKYDKYRKVYYRLLRKGISKPGKNSQINEKQIAVVIMDEHFNYMGETNIGLWKNWCIENTFVTKDGLNIEYLDKDRNEDYLTLKIFTLKRT